MEISHAFHWCNSYISLNLFQFEANYKVDEKDKEGRDVKIEFSEKTDESGKNSGMYMVLQPDEKYRVVEWTVEGDSGFVSEVKYLDKAEVEGKWKTH